MSTTERFLAHVRQGNFRGGQVMLGFLSKPTVRPDQWIDDASEETRRGLPTGFETVERAQEYLCCAHAQRIAPSHDPDCQDDFSGMYQLDALTISAWRQLDHIKHDPSIILIHRTFHVEVHGVHIEVEMTLDPLHDRQTWEAYSSTPLRLSNINGDDDGYDIDRNEHGYYTSCATFPLDDVPLIDVDPELDGIEPEVIEQ